ncbi:hypothetical protein BJX62DRAFT_202386 [Aspergillus germanicus]
MEPGIGTDSPAFLASDSDGANLNNALLAARMSASDADRESDAPVKKQRRVRTGCFTCRDRHLKCDEALGQCQNCRKSGRICRRGVRLNFVDTQVVAPPTYLQPPATSRVTFRDDSRTIASEYVGGFERYPSPEQEPPMEISGQTAGASESAAVPLFKSSRPAADRHLSFKDPTEVSLMQVFVEKIAPWMDVLDDLKHFTRILPLHALEEPMLYAACAACAGSFSDDGMRLYNIAVQMLSESLSDPLRDMNLCAATAIIIEVAETLVFGPINSAQRPRPEKTARPLVRECQWSTHSQGLGKACSWTSIVMELLDCLISHRNLAWDPDTWSIDMNFPQAQPSITGNEETWAQRMIYICAKVTDFWTASLHSGQKPSVNEASQRLQQWSIYNGWCERWKTLVPRSMLPFGELQSWQAGYHTVFPQIWLLGRCATFAQLFYHITRVLLIKADPAPSEHTPEQQALQYHAHQVCGIVSSEKNPGIPIFSTQLLSVVAECLVDRDAQEEALQILDKVTHDTGLKTQQTKDKLVEVWGWAPFPGHQRAPDASMALNPTDPGHSFTGPEAQHGTTDPSLSFGDAMANPYLDPHFTSFHEL